jgi:2Fe-2S ferredoxin
MTGRARRTPVSRLATRPVVRVEPAGLQIEVDPGETVIEAAWRHGLHWPTICFGQAQCMACHLRVLEGAEHLSPLGAEERHALRSRLRGGRRADISGLRLACRAEATGDVVVQKKGVRPADE